MDAFTPQTINKDLLATILKNDWYDIDYPKISPLISVAFRIAQSAHENHVRQKKIGDIPYITHPIMVCKLLAKLGKADDLNIAIALLHDVLEDSEHFKERPSLLKEALQKGLAAEGFDARAAENVAAYVTDHCEELCNDKAMEEGKRTFQVMHAHRMSDCSKLIKILDQTASVIDDIYLESRRDQGKIERFAMKALNVVKAASRGGTPEILGAAQLFKECYNSLWVVMRNPQNAEQSRKWLNVDAFIQKLKDKPPLPHIKLERQHAFQQILHPALERHENSQQHPIMGCVGLTLITDMNGETRIAGYDCMIDRQLQKFSIANRASWYLLGELESFDSGTHVDIGKEGLVSNQLVRHYEIHPPQPLRTFIKAARDAEAHVKDSAIENDAHNASFPSRPVLDNRFVHALQSQEHSQMHLRG